MSVSCECTPEKTHIGRWIVLGVGLLALLVVLLQVRNMRHIYENVDRKKHLKALAKDLEREARALRWQLPLSEECLQFCARLEQISAIHNEKAHAFLLDKDGLVYAHGDAPFLEGASRPGPYSIADIDDDDHSGAPIRDIIKLGKRGGGTYRYRWKKQQPFLVYVLPVRGTELFVGCSLSERSIASQ